jgi:hypothetical protein
MAVRMQEEIGRRLFDSSKRTARHFWFDTCKAYSMWRLTSYRDISLSQPQCLTETHLALSLEAFNVTLESSQMALPSHCRNAWRTHSNCYRNYLPQTLLTRSNQSRGYAPCSIRYEPFLHGYKVGCHSRPVIPRRLHATLTTISRTGILSFK